MKNVALVAFAAVCTLAATIFCLADPSRFMIVVILAGVVLILLGWQKWSLGQGGLGGAPAILFITGITVYVAGSVQLGSEIIYGGTISATQWFLYALSACAALLGIVLGRFAPRRRESKRMLVGRVSSAPDYNSWPLISGFIVGMAVIWVNFATGSIPLFSESINEARKEGVGGALASWSWLGFSLAQFVIIAAISLRYRGLRAWLKWAMILACVASLFMTGSRSFLVLPALALLIAANEYRRPRLWTVVALSVAFLAILSVIGSVRGGASGESGDLVINAERYGYGTGVMASVLSTLQPGAGVLAATLETVPAVVPYQNGTFALRDFPYLVGGQKADYWVTTVILGRNSDVVGGLPPTLVGGLYIDFGIVGVLIGVTALFFFVSRFQPLEKASPVTAGSMTYAFLVSYFLTTFYSYLSLKVNTLVVVLMFGLIALTSSRRKRRSAHGKHRSDEPLCSQDESYSSRVRTLSSARG